MPLGLYMELSTGTTNVAADAMNVARLQRYTRRNVQVTNAVDVVARHSRSLRALFAINVGKKSDNIGQAQWSCGIAQVVELRSIDQGQAQSLVPIGSAQ
jgi:hypothetical protein